MKYTKDDLQFMTPYAQKIYGLYTNIDTDGELWVSLNSFGTQAVSDEAIANDDVDIIGFIDCAKKSGGNGIIKHQWGYSTVFTNGKVVNCKGVQTWIINLDGLHGFITSYPKLFCESIYKNLEIWLKEAAQIWGEDIVNVERCMKRIKEGVKDMDKDNQNAIITNFEAFNDERFGEIRTTIIDGEPWFVAADVCRVLEIANSRDATGRLSEDEKGVAITDTLGGKQEMTIVSESGFYILAFGSRKLEAREFGRWVTHEVLPTIRKTGGYNPRLANDSKPSPYLYHPSDMTDLLFEDTDFDVPYVEDFDIRNAISDLVQVIARRKDDTKKHDTWREFYRGAEEIGKCGLLSRPRGNKTFLDIVQHDEWWALAVQIMCMANEYGIDTDRYIENKKVYERFCVLYRFFRMYITLSEAKQQLGLLETNTLRLMAK